MISKRTIHLAVAAMMLPGVVMAAALADKELLGKALFFDPNLSTPPGQACAMCHSPETGWTGPNPLINAHGAVYEGTVQGRFGNRKPPSSAYTSMSPRLHFDSEEGVFVGGNFWDGRATGHKLGNPAADQVQGPLLNPVEQNNADAQAVCERIERSPFVLAFAGSSYGELFERAFGTGALDCSRDASGTFGRIALAIAAYEGSAEVNPFSSKYDYYLAGKASLTEQERRGLELFEAEDKGRCAACHPSRPGPNGEPPLFTDFTYDNLGVPKNPENPFYDMPDAFNPLGAAWVDRGLGGFLATQPELAPHAEANDGKHKVPTLRNVDKRPGAEFVKAFMHNGMLKSLEQVVHFYNTRDTLPQCPPDFKGTPGESCWPEPEVNQNVNTEEMGDLGLTPEEEAAIVAFMRTLSDGHEPTAATAIASQEEGLQR